MSNNKHLNIEDEESINFSDENLEVIQKKSSTKNINDDSYLDDDSSDDEDDIDVDIDIDESDLDLVEIEDDENLNYIVDDDITEIEENVDFDLIYKLNTNKHRQEGKHTLKRDTIFKGKIEEKKDNENEYDVIDSYNDGFKGFDIEFDSYTDDYVNQNNLTKDVHRVLEEKTNIDFRQNRRKPNKETFNRYYNLLIKELGFRYTKSEIFVELSYYFTDNIFNMFKLLDKKPATIIIKELIQKGYLKDINGINFL